MRSRISQGGVEPLVAQEALDAGNPTARVEQLRRAGMSETVRVDRHSYPLATGFEPAVDEVLAQGLVAVEKDVLGRPATTHRQVLPQRAYDRFGRPAGWDSNPPQGWGHSKQCQLPPPWAAG